jgi:hypothetical protein
MIGRAAVTCGVGWWACQDLNLGPHPYQACSTYALFAARASDGQLSGRAYVTVVVRSIPGLPA